MPKVVIKTFKKQYPASHLVGWYSTHISYWQNDCSSNWYHGWYKNRSNTMYKYENANYFEVGYNDEDSNRSRSIYDINGLWYETRTIIPELPDTIINRINNSKYRSWTISPIKEKIENPRWPAVYRFHIYKGNKSRILRMDIEGTIIQAKYINE